MQKDYLRTTAPVFSGKNIPFISIGINLNDNPHPFMLDSASDVNVITIHAIPNERKINTKQIFTMNGIGAKPITYAKIRIIHQ